jgi:hypothetical protein
MSSGKVEFTEGIQKKIMALLLRDEERVKKVMKLLKYSDFENPFMQDIARLIIEYSQKYGKPISWDALTENVRHFLACNTHLPGTLYWDLLDDMTRAQEELQEDQDVEYVYQWIGLLFPGD